MFPLVTSIVINNIFVKKNN